MPKHAVEDEIPILGARPECDDCDLCKSGRMVVNSTIPRRSEVELVVIGEAPGREEEFQGEPFIGKAGQLLRKALQDAGVNPDNVAYINSARCRPPVKNGKQTTPKMRELDACRKYLREDLDYLKPNVIVALGRTALAAVHKAMALDKVRGAPFICAQFGIKTIATNHPSAILQGYASRDIFVGDLKKAVRESFAPEIQDSQLDRQYQVVEPGQYDSESDAIDALLDIKDYLLTSEEFSFDVETEGINFHEDPVLCVGFATQPQEGIVVPLWGQYEEVKHCTTPKEALAILGTRHGTLSRIWSDDGKKRVLEILKDILESGTPKVGQNAKFDAHMLRYQLGINVCNFNYDTMLAHHCYWEERPHDLNHLRSLETDMSAYDLELHEWAPTFSHSFAMAPNNVLWMYLCGDVDCEYRLKKATLKQLKKAGKWNEWVFREVAMPLQRAFTHMEETGAPIDIQHLLKLGEHFDKKIKSLEITLRNLLRPVAAKLEQDRGHQVFDPDSPKLLTSTAQLWTLLYELMGLPAEVALDARARPGSKPSTDVAALNRLTLSKKVPKAKKAFLNLLLDYRQARKLKTWFIGSSNGTSKATALIKHLRRDGAIHPNLNVHGTKTGRPSSSNPNGQNIPGEPLVRNIVRAPDGFVLADSDFSQIEPRVLGYLSRDPVLLDDLCSCECGESFVDLYDEFEVHLKETQHKRGDVHTNMAMRVFGVTAEEVDHGIRMKSKTITLGVNYGRQAKSLAAGLGMTESAAEKLIKNYFERYAKVKEFHETQIDFLNEYEAVFNVFGRMIHHPGWRRLAAREQFGHLSSTDRGLVNHIKRQIVNGPIQGSAADLMSLATIALTDWEGVEWAQKGYMEMPLVHELMKERFGEYPALLLKYEYGSKPFLSVHDSLITLIPEQHADVVKSLIGDVMMAVPREIVKHIDGPYGSWPNGWYCPAKVTVSVAWGGDEEKNVEDGVKQWTRLQAQT